MNRKTLRKCLSQFQKEVEPYPYDHWEKASFPIVLERTFEGQHVMIEVGLLTKTPDLIEIGISVYSDDWLSPYFPVSMNLAVRPPARTTSGLDVSV